MAVDAVQLVKDQLDPVLTLDPGLDAAIPRQVEAQIVLQGWSAATITEKQAVYISVLATKAMIPRLLNKAMQEVKKAKGGPAETEFQDMVEFLKALQKELADQVKAAAHEAAPEDVITDPTRWPGAGIRGI